MQSADLKLADADINVTTKYLVKYNNDLSEAFLSFSSILVGLVGKGGAIQDELITSSLASISNRAQKMRANLEKMSTELTDICIDLQKDITAADDFKP